MIPPPPFFRYQVKQEELFDVVVVRDTDGGTLGIAVDLWDGEVTPSNTLIIFPNYNIFIVY